MSDRPARLHPDDLPYRSILERLPVVVYVDSWTGPIPQTIFISPTVETLLGYPPALYLEPDRQWFRTVHPDDLETMVEQLTAATEAGKMYELEYRFVRPDGEEIWVRDRATPYRDPETGDRGWIGTIEDINARVIAEDARDTSAMRYATLLENLPAVVYEMDPDDDRRTRYVNRNIVDLPGYSMDEWLDQPDLWTEVLHPDDRERELAAHDVASETGEPWLREYRLIGSDGQLVWVRDQAVLLRDADGVPTRWQGVMVDITNEKEAQIALAAAHEDLEFRVRARTAQLQEANELMGIEIADRRRAEAERAQAQDHLGYLVHNLPAVIYLWQAHENADGSWLTYVGDHIAQMLGYTPDEWNDGGWRTRIHPHDLAMVEAAAEHTLRTGEAFRLQYRYLARDGRVVWVVDHATLRSRDEHGEPLLFEGVMIDITDMKDAERKAQIAEDRFQTLVENGPVAMYAYSIQAWDPVEIQLDYVSEQIADLVDVSHAASADTPLRWLQTVHPDDKADAVKIIETMWQTGEPVRAEYRVIAADGSISWVADRANCVERDRDGRPLRFVGVLADVTSTRVELEDVERQLAPLRDYGYSGPAVTWTEIFDPVTRASRFTYMSPNAARILGYQPEELTMEANHFPRILHPDDADRVLATIEGTDGRWDDSFRLIKRDGSIGYFEGHSRRATPAGEIPERWYGVTVEVTHLYAEEPPFAEPTSDDTAPDGDEPAQALS
jgi:PAS domain S-box-containing protein